MDNFKFIPNCVAIMPVLSSGYQTLAIFDMFNVGALGVILSNRNQNILQAPH